MMPGYRARTSLLTWALTLRVRPSLVRRGD